MIDQADIAFMEQACGRMENAGNWYAFYHLGLGYFVKGAYECAIKAFEKSDLLEPNPWARHAMSCALFKGGSKRGIRKEHFSRNEAPFRGSFLS